MSSQGATRSGRCGIDAASSWRGQHLAPERHGTLGVSWLQRASVRVWHKPGISAAIAGATGAAKLSRDACNGERDTGLDVDLRRAERNLTTVR